MLLVLDFTGRTIKQCEVIWAQADRTYQGWLEPWKFFSRNFLIN
jgi:hypothetical protein